MPLRMLCCFFCAIDFAAAAMPSATSADDAAVPVAAILLTRYADDIVYDVYAARRTYCLLMTLMLRQHCRH